MDTRETHTAHLDQIIGHVEALHMDLGRALNTYIETKGPVPGQAMLYGCLEFCAVVIADRWTTNSLTPEEIGDDLRHIVEYLQQGIARQFPE